MDAHHREARMLRHEPEWESVRVLAVALARRHLPPGEVEDFAQDVLGILWSRWPDLESRVRNERAYLHAVILHECFAWHGRNLARKRFRRLADGEELAAPSDEELHSRSGTVPPDLWRQILQRLRSRERRVLVRFFLRRQSIAEVARRLGLARKQVQRSVRQVLNAAGALREECRPPPL
jgi:RNA polymerase sigma factor (sigma-70 family)